MSVQQRPSSRTKTRRTVLSPEGNNMSMTSADNQQPNPWNKAEVRTSNK